MIKTTSFTQISVDAIQLELNFISWLRSNGKKNRGHAEKSIQAYVSDIRQFSRWFASRTNDLFPQQLIEVDLHAYADYSIDKERVAASTWNRRRVALSLFCQFCLTAGYLQINPFQGIRMLQKAKEAPKSLTRSDFLAFQRKAEQAVNAASTQKQRLLAIRNRAMIALMASAGLREGELCELALSDLLLTDRKSIIKIQDGKTGQSTAFLSSDGRRSLDAWLEISEPSERLFGSITPRQVQRIVAGIGNLAGLKVTPHMLRHTFVYKILDDTHDIGLAMQLARHTRVEQTLRYGQRHDADLQAAVNRLSF